MKSAIEWPRDIPTLTPPSGLLPWTFVSFHFWLFHLKIDMSIPRLSGSFHSAICWALSISFKSSLFHSLIKLVLFEICSCIISKHFVLFRWSCVFYLINKLVLFELCLFHLPIISVLFRLCLFYLNCVYFFSKYSLFYLSIMFILFEYCMFHLKTA